MSDESVGCVTPSKGPILSASSEGPVISQTMDKKEIPMVQAHVGKPAPDFELNAFHGGGFKNVKLSDYKGKWIVVCFYPGDFTFV